MVIGERAENLNTISCELFHESYFGSGWFDNRGVGG